MGIVRVLYRPLTFSFDDMNEAESSCKYRNLHQDQFLTLFLISTHFRRLLRRLLEVIFSHLEIVLHRHGHAVADPYRSHLSGELVCQFHLTG